MQSRLGLVYSRLRSCRKGPDQALTRNHTAWNMARSAAGWASDVTFGLLQGISWRWVQRTLRRLPHRRISPPRTRQIVGLAAGPATRGSHLSHAKCADHDSNAPRAHLPAAPVVPDSDCSAPRPHSSTSTGTGACEPCFSSSPANAFRHAVSRSGSRWDSAAVDSCDWVLAATTLGLATG